MDVLTDSPQRFSPGQVLYLRQPGAPPAPVRLESSRPHKQALLVKLERVDSRDEAERLRRLELVIPEEEAKNLPAGRHYPFRLVGCRVLSRDSGAELGDVTGVLETPAGSLLEVQGPKGEVLIPLVRALSWNWMKEHGRSSSLCRRGWRI